jgi:hypothetical protein
MTTMSKKLKGRSLSLAAECALPRIQADLQRRLVLGGMLGAASLLAARPVRAFAASADRTIVSPDGIIRTTLESYVNDAGEDFRLVLTTYPPGVGLPLHHHSSVAHNYILEGIAESQYARSSSVSRQDKATRTRPASSTWSFAIRIELPRSDI